mmetsp:Transcript_12424/g.41320  ORF Transcript_12424/g.41320 Transcript_12424/m.41320 type:complete len:217 (+) Transcript_12424:1592-2242(+)
MRTAKRSSPALIFAKVRDLQIQTHPAMSAPSSDPSELRREKTRSPPVPLQDHPPNTGPSWTTPGTAQAAEARTRWFESTRTPTPCSRWRTRDPRYRSRLGSTATCVAAGRCARTAPLPPQRRCCTPSTQRTRLGARFRRNPSARSSRSGSQGRCREDRALCCVFHCQTRAPPPPPPPSSPPFARAGARFARPYAYLAYAPRTRRARGNARGLWTTL